MCGVFPWQRWLYGRSVSVYRVSWHWKLSAHVILKYEFDLACHCQSKRILRVVQKLKSLSQRGKKKMSILYCISVWLFVFYVSTVCVSPPRASLLSARACCSHCLLILFAVCILSPLYKHTEKLVILFAF